jgi:hypothetical protein
MRKLVLTFVVALLALSSFALPAFAQSATVVSRSGERVTGNFDGVGNGNVFIRLNQNDQRQWPIGNVLVIDFVGGASGLPDTELSVAAKPEHLMMLRDGSHVTGQLTGTTGGGDSGQPHQVVFRTGGQERRVNVDQVARIYLGNYPFKPTTSPAPGPAPEGAVRVPATSIWVPTNITVRRGDRLAFTASGQVKLSPEESDMANPNGSTRNRRAPSAPLPNELAGALIGRVGNSAPFLIGSRNVPLTMPADGQLFLGVNDDGPNDNGGEFVVEVRFIGGTRRP